MSVVTVTVTLSAGGPLSNAKHFIAWSLNTVIIVALYTLADLHQPKRSLMWTRLKETCLTNVALPADICHRSQSRRRSSVIPVAVVACGCREILLIVQSLRMHACFVFVVL